MQGFGEALIALAWILGVGGIILIGCAFALGAWIY